MGGRNFSNWFFVDVALGTSGGSIDLTRLLSSVKIEETEKKFSQATIELANPELILTQDQILELMFYHNLLVRIRFGYKNGPTREVIMTTVRSKFSFSQDGVPTIEISTHARGKTAGFTRKERKELHKRRSIADIINLAAGRSGFNPNFSRSDMDKLSVKMEEIPNDGETDLEFISRLCNTVNHVVHMEADDNETLYIIRQYDRTNVDHIFGYFKGMVQADAPILSFDVSVDTLVPARMQGQIFDSRKGTLIPVEVKSGTDNIPKGRVIGRNAAETHLKDIGNLREELTAAFAPEDNWPNWHEPDPQKIRDLKDFQEKLRLKNAMTGELKLIGDVEVKLYDLCKVVGVNNAFAHGPWQIVGVRHDLSGAGFLTDLTVKRPAFNAREVSAGTAQEVIDSAVSNSPRLKPPNG